LDLGTSSYHPTLVTENEEGKKKNGNIKSEWNLMLIFIHSVTVCGLLLNNRRWTFKFIKKEKIKNNCVPPSGAGPIKDLLPISKTEWFAPVTVARVVFNALYTARFLAVIYLALQVVHYTLMTLHIT
jgi:hypothetical protein